MDKVLILFIHGLNGSKESWKNDKGEYFGDLLLENQLINKNYDVEYFEYETNLTNKKFQEKKNWLNLGLNINDTKKDKNIMTISDELMSVIEFKYYEYDSIILIGHSMGGLISKYCILEGKFDSKIEMFYSIAVPNNGAELATLFPKFKRSKQVEDLKSISDFLTKVNQKWIRNSKELPYTYYFIGTNDTVVEKNSALGFENREVNEEYKVIHISKGHIFISKPDRDDLVFQAIEKSLIDFINQKEINAELRDEAFEDAGQYDNMIFFIKLILADIVSRMKKLSKESYYKFEVLYRKLPLREQKKLSELEEKIKDLYNECFIKYESGKIEDSNELISKVKELMRKEDDKYLKISNDLFNHLHKFGLLHHIADKESEDIFGKKVKQMLRLMNLERS